MLPSCQKFWTSYVYDYSTVIPFFRIHEMFLISHFFVEDELINLCESGRLLTEILVNIGTVKLASGRHGC